MENMSVKDVVLEKKPVSYTHLKAVVLVKRGERKADVVVGKNVNKQFAINSMVGAVKAMLL